MKERDLRLQEQQREQAIQECRDKFLELNELLTESNIPFETMSNEHLGLEVAAVFYPTMIDCVFRVCGYFCNNFNVGLTVNSEHARLLTTCEVYEIIKKHYEESTL